MEFMNYSSKMRELLMLIEMDKNTSITQHELSKASSIVASMVNNYVKRFVENDYIEKMGNNRNTRYILTAKGKEYKNYLLVSYLSELMDNIKYSEKYLHQTLMDAIGREKCRLLLYGAGETGKVCANILKSVDSVKIVGYVDDDMKKVGSYLEGYPILGLQEIFGIEYDKILVTTFQNIESIKEKVNKEIKNAVVLTLG